MTGKHLSHYLIESELGRGGMGIVYRAKDTKLDRTVAIKVLPASALASEDDRARFYREAKAAAALNHPNIAQVYQIDEAVPEGGAEDEPRPFIAMEFIDGETLDAQIQKRPLKISVAIRVATKIAEALSIAHGKGIVHRDIKSANIMLTADGEPKVLDFGLAQTSASTKLTRMGSTLGTISYMSPEQARGEEVDSRTDLYSLGAVLYEIITGRAPFAGEYEQAVIYSILNEPPEPLSGLRTGVSLELERIVNKLLAKDASRRYASAADVIVDLNNLDQQDSTTSVASAQYSTVLAAPVQEPEKKAPLRTVAASLVVLLVGIALGWGLLSVLQPDEPAGPLSRVRVSAIDMQGIRFPRISPTGDYMAIRAASMQGSQGLFLRAMDSDRFEYIPESERGGNWEYDFSPDGSHIGFSDGLNGGIFTVVVPNGIPQRRTELGRFSFWEDENTIIFSNDSPGGGEIYRYDLVSDSSTQVEYERPELAEGLADVVKTYDREHGIAYGHQLRRANIGEFHLFSLNLKSGDYQILESNAANPEFVAGGFLTYQLGGDDGKLVVRPLDRASGRFTGRPIDALGPEEATRWTQYAVSPAGDLLYLPNDGTQTLNPAIWEVDTEAKLSTKLPLVVPEGQRPEDITLSSDGRYIAFFTFSEGETNLFGFDLEEGVQVQYTFGGFNVDPTFGPEDETLYFSRYDAGEPSVVRAPFNGSSIGESEVVLHDAAVTAASANGSMLALITGDENGRLVHQLYDLHTDSMVWESAEPGNRNSGRIATFSPDGRYVAVLGDSETDRPIVVRSTSTAERHVLPDIDARQIVWAESGGYIYFRAPNGIFKIQVRISPAFSVLGEPELVLTPRGSRSWDVSADESKMYVEAIEIGFSDEGDLSTRRDIIWLQNWSDHLKREFGE